MSRIISTAKLIRRNWKKSTFLFGVLAYGGSYFVEKYQTFQMMRAYCEEAKKYGERPLQQLMKPKHVTVILNPEANNKKSNIQFEKFAAPLLHLAGFKVSIFLTEKEKQAQELMQVMSNTDAVIVAGGNGTLQEVVTGLLRRPDAEEKKLPLGIVPLGKTNTVAEFLFGSKSSSRAQLMAEAVMSVIRETTVNLDVLKIQYADEDKPVFGLCNFEQGIFADVEPLVQKYWYLGALKDKFTYFRHSLKDWQPIENKSLEYVAPCSGCSKCYVPPKQKEQVDYGVRWWQVFVPKKTEAKAAHDGISNKEKLSSIINEECGKHLVLLPEYSTVSVSTISADAMGTDSSGALLVKIFPKDLSVKQFISSGLSHRRSKHQDTSGTANIIEARELIIETENLSQTEAVNLVKTMDVPPVQAQSTISDRVESPNSTEIQSPSSVGVDSVDLSGTESDNSVESELINLGETVSVDSAQTESAAPAQTETGEKSKNDTNQFSYIDNEKYRRASCSISVIPKLVTVYG